MEIQKYSDFILNEAKVNKEEVISDLTKMFKEKPNVEITSFPNEKGMYSLSGMKKYLSDKYTAAQVDDAHNSIMNDKKKNGVKSVRIKIEKWNQLVPYWYMDLTTEEVNKLKEKYQNEEREKNKKEIDKSQSRRKEQKAADEAKIEVKKEVAAKKSAARKVSKKSPVKKSGEGVEPAPRTRTRRKK